MIQTPRFAGGLFQGWPLALLVSGLWLLAGCGAQVEVYRWETAEATNLDRQTGRELRAGDSVGRANFALRLRLQRAPYTKVRSGRLPAGRDTLFTDRLRGISLSAVQLENNMPVVQGPLNDQFVVGLRGEGPRLDSLTGQIAAYQFLDQLDFRLVASPTLAPGRYRFVVRADLDQGRALRDTTAWVELRR
jgi:hypothetical protein